MINRYLGDETKPGLQHLEWESASSLWVFVQQLKLFANLHSVILVGICKNTLNLQKD